MKFIHVASGGSRESDKVDYSKAMVKWTRNSLYSLIGGLRQKDFGYGTVRKVAKDIRNYYDENLAPKGGLIFIDSGGYSIIKGDVKPTDISRFIDCYHYYLKKERDFYNFIFSLDIPYFRKYRGSNTKSNIYEFNQKSIEESVKMMKKYPEIRNKFYFVWHFKIIDQYKIWKRLYEEFDLNSIIKNRAIGGLVSMRDIVNINYSPFTALAFRCFNDYLLAGDYNLNCRLHTLGVNLKYDRLQIALLEQLFKRYLDGKSKAVFTYDSINYLRTAQIKVKDLEIFDLNGDCLTIYDKIKEIPEDFIKYVYPPEVHEDITEELNNNRADERLLNSNAFAPLNIYSNICLDRFFERIVAERKFVDLMFEYKNIVAFLSNATKILDDLGKKSNYPRVFTRGVRESIINNLRKTFLFHRWYVEGRDPQRLDDLVTGFIEGIGFPATLSDKQFNRMIES